MDILGDKPGTGALWKSRKSQYQFPKSIFSGLQEVWWKHYRIPLSMDNPSTMTKIRSPMT